MTMTMTMKIFPTITKNNVQLYYYLVGIIYIFSCCCYPFVVEGVEIFNPSRFPFENVMNVENIPQFVTITFNGDVTPAFASLFRQLVDIRDHNGCGIKSTFFVSFQNVASATYGGGDGFRDCSLIDGLVKGLHEIATHTYNRTTTQNPSQVDIDAAIGRLVGNCGFSQSVLRGFRSPNLQYSQTILNHLNNDLGLLYDSTLIPVDYEQSNYGYYETWPFTFTDEISVSNALPSCRGCDNITIEANPGLWEIPLTPIYNPDNTPNLPMDYSPYYDTDISSILQDNLERHYFGNRAPLGLHFHGGWLSANGDEFKNWVNDTLSTYDDVHFITNYELIEWMRNPIPKQVYRPTCEGQITNCLPPVASCVFGAFNSESCECECYVPYCKDSNGSCSRICNANETDAVYSELDSHCCPDGYNGYRPYENCTKFYRCILGEVREIAQPNPLPPIPTYQCTEGTRFDLGFGACVFERDVTCIEVEDAHQCGGKQETPSPSSSPSASFLPTITPVPTVTASVSPSSEPTLEPSNSYRPTIEASNTPTGSTIPSSQPSLLPSLSIQPSAGPTDTPTVSDEPSIEPTPAPFWDYEVAEPFLEQEREVNKVVLWLSLLAVAIVGGLFVLAFNFQEELRDLDIKKKLSCRRKEGGTREQPQTPKRSCRTMMYDFFFGFLKDRPGI